MELENFHIFLKITQVSSLMKIRPVETELFHAVRHNVYSLGFSFGNERAMCAVLRPKRYAEWLVLPKIKWT